MINSNDIRRLRGVDTILALIFYEAQRTAPYEFHIGYLGGKRTAKQQNELYKAKKSQRDGYNKISNHQQGLAFDFVIYDGTEPIWDYDLMEEVARHIMHIGRNVFNTELIWGLDWDRDGIRGDKDFDEHFYDAGHIELL